MHVLIQNPIVKKIKKMISKEKIKEVEKKLGHTLIAGKFLKDLSFINEKENNKSQLFKFFAGIAIILNVDR